MFDTVTLLVVDHISVSVYRSKPSGVLPEQINLVS